MSSPSSHGSSDQDFADFLENELELDGDEVERVIEASPPGVEASEPEGLLCNESDGPAEHAKKRQKLGHAEVVKGELCPPHPGSLHGICIRCGQAIQDGVSSGVALRYIHQGLQISEVEAVRMREQGLRRNLDRRKLSLVLDLDHTLLNSTKLDEVSPEEEACLQKVLAREDGQKSQMLFRLPASGMWTKLRPYVREFLAAAQKLAEMHIYTHGSQEYAAVMAKLLDPDGKYFQGRIVSQADSTKRHVKNLDIILGASESVVIMDDTEGVWPDHRDNLILVERYIFFPADSQRFQSGACLLERGKEESAVGGQLSTSLKILETLHQRVFSDSDAGRVDVRQHLRALESGILEGVIICFTSVIPSTDTDAASHPCWRLAEKLGATCSVGLSKSTTHLVCGAAKNTEKVKQARALGVPLVSVGWLYAAAFLWKRMSETDFPITAATASPVLDESQDVQAALEAAGGGTGAHVDIV